MDRYVFLKNCVIHNTMTIHFVSKMSTNNAFLKKYTKYAYIQIKHLYRDMCLCVWEIV